MRSHLQPSMPFGLAAVTNLLYWVFQSFHPLARFADSRSAEVRVQDNSSSSTAVGQRCLSCAMVRESLARKTEDGAFPDATALPQRQVCNDKCELVDTSSHLSSIIGARVLP